MTKFEQKSFSTPANSQTFRDNWDDVFLVRCRQCHKELSSTLAGLGLCSSDCVRAFSEDPNNADELEKWRQLTSSSRKS